VLERCDECIASFPFRLTGTAHRQWLRVPQRRPHRVLLCQRLELSRGRPHHKNDNPHIEQKKRLPVRRLSATTGSTNMEQWDWLDELYTSLLRPFNNCFSRS